MLQREMSFPALDPGSGALSSVPPGAAPLPLRRGRAVLVSAATCLPLSSAICTAWGKGPLTLSLKLPETTWRAWWWWLRQEGKLLSASALGFGWQCGRWSEGRGALWASGREGARRCGGTGGER